MIGFVRASVLAFNLSWQSCGEAAYWDWKIGIGQYAPKDVYHEGSALLLYIFAASYFTFLPPSILHFSPLLLYIFADLYPPLAPLKGGAGDQGHQRPQGHQRRAKGHQRHKLPLVLIVLPSPPQQKKRRTEVHLFFLLPR